MDEQIKKSTEDHKVLLDKRNINFFEWYRGILAIAVGSLGLLVTLAPKSESQYQHQLFSCTLVLLALSILSSVISLYAPIDALNRALKHSYQNISDMLEGKKASSTFSAPLKIYALSRYFSYFTYILSLIFLVVYAITVKQP